MKLKLSVQLSRHSSEHRTNILPEKILNSNVMVENMAMTNKSLNVYICFLTHKSYQQISITKSYHLGRPLLRFIQNTWVAEPFSPPVYLCPSSVSP